MTCFPAQRLGQNLQAWLSDSNCCDCAQYMEQRESVTVLFVPLVNDLFAVRQFHRLPNANKTDGLCLPPKGRGIIITARVSVSITAKTSCPVLDYRIQ